MTLDALAAKLGISTGTLSRLERGEIERPGRTVITKLKELSGGVLQYEDIVPE